MIQDDFDQLLTATAEVFDVPKAQILNKTQLGLTKARWFIAHCIYHGHVHLRNVFIEKSGISSSGFYKAANYADKAIHDSTEDLCIINEIRAKVGLMKLKHAVVHKDTIPHSKTLFGIDYTETDVLRFRNACRGAKEYMQKLCSIGRQPIPDGMVFSPLRKKPTYESWYNE